MMFIVWKTDDCHLCVIIAHMLVGIVSAVGSETKRIHAFKVLLDNIAFIQNVTHFVGLYNCLFLCYKPILKSITTSVFHLIRVRSFVNFGHCQVHLIVVVKSKIVVALSS